MRAAKLRSLDHLVGTAEQLRWHVDTECLGSLEIYHQLELDRGLDGKLARFRALEDAVGISRRASEIMDEISSVG